MSGGSSSITSRRIIAPPILSGLMSCTHTSALPPSVTVNDVSTKPAENVSVLKSAYNILPNRFREIDFSNLILRDRFEEESISRDQCHKNMCTLAKLNQFRRINLIWRNQCRDFVCARSVCAHEGSRFLMKSSPSDRFQKIDVPESMLTSPYYFQVLSLVHLVFHMFAQNIVLANRPYGCFM